MPKRESFTELEQLTVWKQDVWHCRYCLYPVFFGPALQLLDRLNPGHGYYHRNGAHSSMLKLFAKKWASVDHIVPVNSGGRNNLDNLATACVDCNIKKNDDPIGYEPRAIPSEVRRQDWDGFTLLYLELCRADDRWTRAVRDVYDDLPMTVEF